MLNLEKVNKEMNEKLNQTKRQLREKRKKAMKSKEDLILKIEQKKELDQLKI